METPERIWFLLSRNLSGDATEDDIEELNRLLQQRPELMQQYDMLQQLWTAHAPAPEEPVVAEKISRILTLSAAEKAAGGVSPGRLHTIKWRKVAAWAAVVTAITLGSWLFVIWDEKQHSLAANEIIAPRGSKSRTILPDGSTVWLNAGSRITYADFNGPVREVTLEGEAFFDIVSVPQISLEGKGKKPFIVHAGHIDIKVLGTAFNVKSYPDERTIETTLLRGLVQITRKDDKKTAPVYLHPNEKIVLPTIEPDGVTDSGKTEAVVANTARRIIRIDSTVKENEHIETAWVYNRLEFRGDSFEQLAPKLERWYNIRIFFEDEAARKLVFNGSLENETMEQAFMALKTAVPFNATIKNNEIYIKSYR